VTCACTGYRVSGWIRGFWREALLRAPLGKKEARWHLFNWCQAGSCAPHLALQGRHRPPHGRQVGSRLPPGLEGGEQPVPGGEAHGRHELRLGLATLPGVGVPAGRQGAVVVVGIEVSEGSMSTMCSASQRSPGCGRALCCDDASCMCRAQGVPAARSPGVERLDAGHVRAGVHGGRHLGFVLLQPRQAGEGEHLQLA